MMIKSAAQIEKVRRACRVVAEVLQQLREHARPGATTAELDVLAEAYIRAQGCLPAFKGYQGYPKTLCTSVNDQIVHGIPSGYVLKNGDLLSVDVGAVYDGFYGDGAVTLLMGEVSEKHRLLAEVTEGSLYKGIAQARAGNRLSDISHAVQSHVERFGFAVVRDFVGHGIGAQLHEEPQLPNFGPPGQGPLLKAGMLLALEPMVNEYTPHVRILSDRWTAVTVDGGYSAHFEHTILVTDDGPEILTRLGE
ncbi:MAG TPA: type I methionyl aminopeptidase [Acidobacteriota bacterium]|nr:type I methionyl aminopeptidase [Acidobacteriota bacterium]HQM62633.1 type I methionyl aminopeptidase [Acidobacteriota bacterium]